jgi:hypothetical protein
VAIIRVGAATEVELKEKKHRVEDALSATRAAVEEGIVPGGGVALINAISGAGRDQDGVPDEQTGVTIVRRALEEPMRQLAINAGKDGAVIVENVRRQQKEQGDAKVGYDVLRDEYVNMVKAGIIDPVKVTRSAVENAASIGAMILTTEALITDIPEPVSWSAVQREPHGAGPIVASNGRWQISCRRQRPGSTTPPRRASTAPVAAATLCRQRCVQSAVAVGMHNRFPAVRADAGAQCLRPGSNPALGNANAAVGLRSIIGFNPKTDRGYDAPRAAHARPSATARRPGCFSRVQPTSRCATARATTRRTISTIATRPCRASGAA